MKDWDDLYRLYWVCVLERNRVATRAHEMHRLKAGYGENEVDSRLKVVSTSDIDGPKHPCMMIQHLSLADMISKTLKLRAYDNNY